MTQHDSVQVNKREAEWPAQLGRHLVSLQHPLPRQIRISANVKRPREMASRRYDRRLHRRQIARDVAIVNLADNLLMLACCGKLAHPQLRRTHRVVRACGPEVARHPFSE